MCDNSVIVPSDAELEEAVYIPEEDVIESDLQHIDNFVEGFESIINQYRSKGMVNYSGFESYTIGVMKANSLTTNVYNGFENFITDGIKKLWEMIKNMCKSIYQFFFGGKNDENKEIKEEEKEIKQNVLLLENLDKKCEGVVSNSEIAEVINEAAEEVKNNKPIKENNFNKSDVKTSVKANYKKTISEKLKKVFKDNDVNVTVVKSKSKKIVDDATSSSEFKEAIRKATRSAENEIVEGLIKRRAIKKFKTQFQSTLNKLKTMEVSKEEMFMSNLQDPNFWVLFDKKLENGDYKVVFYNFGKIIEEELKEFTNKIESIEKSHNSDDNESTEFLKKLKGYLNDYTRMLGALRKIIRTVNVGYEKAIVNIESIKAKYIAEELAKLTNS